MFLYLTTFLSKGSYSLSFSNITISTIQEITKINIIQTEKVVEEKLKTFLAINQRINRGKTVTNLNFNLLMMIMPSNLTYTF